jgi:tRNA A37 threonylcarbamoyladenosine dehydratase
LGGTGAYILDLLAKTPVAEIHLFDDDVLYAHNAFRSPGAASLDEVKESPTKVDYLFKKYDPIRRNIFAHSIRIASDNIDELRTMSIVFIAIDSGPAKKVIIDSLLANRIPFIDCGMGVRRVENSLGGQLRVTTVIEGHSSHIANRISFGDENDNEYDWNIQTADLNMMNAAMAVIKWKKLAGYYIDTKHEYNSTYTLTRNQMVSGEIVE